MIDVTAMRKNQRNERIVERLKKLLEGRTDDFTFTGKYLRKEVLGDKKCNSNFHDPDIRKQYTKTERCSVCGEL